MDMLAGTDSFTDCMSLQQLHVLTDAQQQHSLDPGNMQKTMWIRQQYSTAGDSDYCSTA